MSPGARRSMDYNFNDIEKYIAAGGDPEAIANAFANRLNAALSKAKSEDELNAAGDALSKAWNDYVNVYAKYNTLNHKTDEYYMTTPEIRETFRSVIRLVDGLEGISKELEKGKDTLHEFYKKIGL